MKTASPIDQPFYRKHYVTWLGDPTKKKQGAAEKDRERTAWPKLSYLQALRSWFVYAGQPYSVDCCTQEVFIAWVELVTANWRDEERAEHLELHPTPNEKDIARWYTLDTLREMKVQDLQLFESEQEARAAGKNTVNYLTEDNSRFQKKRNALRLYRV